MKPRFAQIRIPASLIAIAILAYACFWTLRLGYADLLVHTDSPENASRAVELVAGNARYRAHWAAMLDQSGNNPAGSLSALEAAVACNPRDSSSWVELGLRAEVDKDFVRAERSLLQAARIDRQYDPRWTLVNFYFRQSDVENFWLWARQAAVMLYGDAAPLFRLCWRVTQDPEVILKRAIPDDPKILAQYLGFLLDDNHLDAVEPVAQRVAEHAGPGDLPILFTSCDRLLSVRQLPGALRIWNAISRRRLISYPALEPDKGLSLTNGDFRELPLSHGFDWRLHSPEGVSFSQGQSLPLLRVTFSGKQPESCEILSQSVPLLPGQPYRFRFRYRTSGIAPDTGLRWRIFDFATGAELAARSTDMSNEKPTEGDLLFSTPPDTRLARVALTYQRTLGTTRIEGSVLLIHTSLEFALP